MQVKVTGYFKIDNSLRDEWFKGRIDYFKATGAIVVSSDTDNGGHILIDHGGKCFTRFMVLPNKGIIHFSTNYMTASQLPTEALRMMIDIPAEQYQTLLASNTELSTDSMVVRDIQFIRIVTLGDYVVHPSTFSFEEFFKRPDCNEKLRAAIYQILMRDVSNYSTDCELTPDILSNMITGYPSKTFTIGEIELNYQEILKRVMSVYPDFHEIVTKHMNTLHAINREKDRLIEQAKTIRKIYTY